MADTKEYGQTYIGNEKLAEGANPFIGTPPSPPDSPDKNGLWIGILVVLVLILISIIAFILFKLYVNKSDKENEVN